MPCPFCQTVPAHLFPYEDGPKLELYEGNVDDASDGALMRHRVYCGKENRNFALVYRPSPALPVCPSCESDFDVVAEAPEKHFALTATFQAAARCENCSEDLGSITYERSTSRTKGYAATESSALHIGARDRAESPALAQMHLRIFQKITKHRDVLEIVVARPDRRPRRVVANLRARYAA
jgi:hypothetical protein